MRETAPDNRSDTVIDTIAAETVPMGTDSELARRMLTDLYDQGTTIIVGNGVLFAVILAYYWEYLSGSFLLGWSGLMFLAISVRAANMLAYHANPNRWNTRVWEYFFTLASMVLGGSWAVFGIKVIQETSADIAVIGFVSIAGIVGASASTSSASKTSFYALAGTTLLPMAIAAFMRDSPTYQVSSVLFVLYIVVLGRASNRIYRSLQKSVLFGIRNEALAADLARQTRVDSLTGLLNRRALNQGFEEAWSEGIEHNQAVGLILCDVDYFKQYNDSLGHLEGDECLQKIANAIASVTRAEDSTTARFGGEEFAILIPSCDSAILEDIALRVHRAVLELRIPHPSSSIGSIVTVSVGTSVLQPAPGKPINELIRTADNAMYRAKANGRNRICADLAAA
ncbi:MAG: diguanylate cyclase [Pseudomonadales bacterium]